MKDTNRKGSGSYGEMGVGNSAMPFREVTRKGQPGVKHSGTRSQGEIEGVGTMHSAYLNERPNLSNPRNRGPERAGSSSAAPLKVVNQEVRKTGRL